MPTSVSLYLFALALSAAFLAPLGAYAWRHRGVAGAVPFTILMLVAVIWCLTNALELASPDLLTKLFWADVEFTAYASTPVVWLALALQYTGRGQWLTRRNLALLTIVPFITVVLLWTSNLHGLMRRDVYIDTTGPFAALGTTYGPWFWVHTAYTGLLFLIAIGLLIEAARRGPARYRGQPVVLVSGIFLPMAWNIMYIVGLSPTPHDTTPAIFGLAGIVTAWGLFQYRLFDIMPVARETVVESMSDSVIVLDMQNRIVDLNLAAERLLDRPAAQAIGRQVEEVFSSWSGWVGQYLDATETQAEITVGEGEAQHVYDLHIAPLMGRRRQLLGQVIGLHDITRSKKAEDALKESEQRLRQITSSLHEAIWLRDARTLEVLYVNPAYEKLWGRTCESFYRDPASFLEAVHPEDKERVLAAVRRQYQGISFDEQYRIVRPDGSIRWIWGRTFPIRNEAGEVHRIAAIAEDITERKRAEAEIAQRNVELMQANEELDAFAHTAAHELKNPLAVIVGYSELMEQYGATLPADDRKGYLHLIAQHGRKMSNIIKELLLLASVRETEAHLLPLDMARIVAEAQKRLADMIEEYQGELVLPDTWPPALGYGPWVEEVWINYLSNALKYGGSPPRAELGAAVQTDGMVRFWVRDNGRGLKSGDRDQLFKPFIRLEDMRIEGNGLGLSVVRHIVEKLGGQVGVERGSKAGQGSLFFFTLPGADS